MNRQNMFYRLLSFVCVALICCAAVSTASAKTKNTTKHKATTSVTKKTTTRSISKKQNTNSSARVRKASRKGRSAAANSKTARKPRGQQAIESERAREIQAALIRERYLDGEPTGIWDNDTKQALIKYQGDNGWQKKVVPDSRALIKLGLGPDHSKLLNPDTVTRPGLAREIVPGGATPE